MEHFQRISLERFLHLLCHHGHHHSDGANSSESFAVDKDGDGNISALEMRNCLKSMGEELSAADAEAFLESNGDGKLGYEGFLKLVEVEEDIERERTLREAFAAFEMDGMGCITERSLRLALLRLGKEKKVEECNDMIKKFDLNGNGFICFDEFKLMML